MFPSLKSYYRNFKKHKVIYSITIGGFALSLTVLVLIISYIVEEKSVDNYYTNIDQMYRIKQSNENAKIPERLYPVIIDAAPEIENLCLLNKNGTLYEYGDSKNWVQAVSTNKQFLDVFSIEIVHGNKQNLLESKTDVLITESFAKQVFGELNPIGKTIEFGNMEEKEVKAIIKDPKETSSLKYEVLFNLQQELFKSSRGYNKETYYLYDAVFKIHKNTNRLDIQNKLSDILSPYPGYEDTQLKIQPFKEVYFDLNADNDSFKHANINMIRLLSFIALIILILSILNYVNLTTAFYTERRKEVCIRKASGAYTKSILYQFIRESYISIFIAIILAFLVVNNISPLFSEIFQKEINVYAALKNPSFILVLFLIFFIVGSISSIIPALLISKAQPIELLQRRMILKNNNIRGIYNGIQLVASICLIISLIVILKQIHYVKTKDPGFKKEYLLEVSLLGKTREKVTLIKETLLKYPQIVSIASSHGIPFATYTSSSGTWKEGGVEYKIENLVNINTDTSFLETFDLNLIHGRNFRFTDKDVSIINESTYNYFQEFDIEGQKVFGSEIIGIVEDFHFKKLHSKIGFLQLSYNPDFVTHLNIRISGSDIPGTLKLIKGTLNKFEPGITFEPRFYDDWIQSMYKKEESQAKAIKIYAVLALLLSCFGILGMSKFSAIKRTKEVGVRKVNGAKIFQVMAMLNLYFVKWVLFAFIISCPIAWYVMNRWLENFAYKIEISWWIYLTSGITVLLITIITVSWQSWRAARRNPVEALRYE